MITKTVMNAEIWMTSAVTLVCVIFVAVQAECPQPEVLRVGLLQPFSEDLGFETTAAAATMAIEDAQSNGILNETEIRYVKLSCYK